MRRGRDKGRRQKRAKDQPSRTRRSPRDSRQSATGSAIKSHPEGLIQSPEVRKLLEGIGTPPATPFKADPFQLEALAALEFEDVLVTAPTGSGKTWIAREEIRRLIQTGRRAWYTTPLKALTNSKYQEFSDEFGSDRVGILTGDRKENSGRATDRGHHGNLSQSTIRFAAWWQRCASRSGGPGRSALSR